MAKGIYIGVGGKARKAKKGYIGIAEYSLISNGDFSNSFQNWRNYDAWEKIEFSVINNELQLKCISSLELGKWNYISQSVAIDEGHIFYLTYKVNFNSWTNGDIENSGLRFTGVGNAILVPPSNIGEWQTLSHRVEGKSSTVFSIGLISALANSIVLLDDIKLYDLTTMYGEGNEPTTEWCDENLEKLKQLYQSQNGKARKVKKAYIGVGGVARPFFSSEKQLGYYGTATDLYEQVNYLAATNLKDYAIFAGGADGDTTYDVVTFYGSTLVRGKASDLNEARSHLPATSIGGYAIFGGGVNEDGDNATTADAYTNQLVKMTISSLSYADSVTVATSNTNYALFGHYNSKMVEAYNASLVKTTTSSGLSAEGNYKGAATNIGDYALFGGGGRSRTSPSYSVDAFNSSLVKSTPTSTLSEARYRLAATSNGKYAIFGGGIGTNGYSATTEAYNSSLVKHAISDLSIARYDLTSTSVDEFAIFATGYNGSPVGTVDVYNSALVRSEPNAISPARYNSASASIGNYALIGGGFASSKYYSDVDVYQVIG